MMSPRSPVSNSKIGQHIPFGPAEKELLRMHMSADKFLEIQPSRGFSDFPNLA